MTDAVAPPKQEFEIGEPPAARTPFTAASGRTVSDLLLAGVARHPDREFIVYERPDGTSQSSTWHEVLTQSEAITERLRAAGIGAGDRLHVHLGNRPEFLLTWFAAAFLGASIVPTNTASTPAEIAYAIAHAETRLSVTEEAFERSVQSAHDQSRSGGPIWCCERDALAAPDTGSASDTNWTPVSPSARPSDELAILYTSGTTSRPKGVIVSHANYVYAGEVVAKGFGLTPDDRLVITLPLFHANAQYYSTMGALQAGATLIVLPRFSASRFVDQCIAHRATVASLFAAPIRMILAQEAPPHWRNHELRLVTFAQNIGKTNLAEWDRLIGAPLLQIYGMTETIGPPLMNPIWGQRDPEKLGRVSLGYTCRVVREDGSDADLEEPGELLVGGIPGSSLTAGYLHDPVATNAAIVEGWLHSGDMVRVDRQGDFTFVDRLKDMIKRGGENVAASEVESVLRDHPGIADAAVIGVPDSIRDEAIVAFVVPSSPVTANELRDWCSGRLAKFRVPGDFVFRPELPRTPVGKVQKNLLSADYQSSRTP